MLFRSFAIVATLVATMATTSTVLAQKNGTTKAASRIPHQAQAEAAARKAVSDPRFTAALNAARADEVKKMLVASGASPDILVAVQKAAYNWSSSGGGPQFDYNGGGYTCTLWHYDWYWVWHSTPPALSPPIQKGNTADGSWNFRWICAGLFTQNPYNYQH